MSLLSNEAEADLLIDISCYRAAIDVSSMTGYHNQVTVN
jgi:hypothetical protein